MKITKEKLNKIIKEEIEAVLSEEELSLWQKTKDFFDGRAKARRERMANIDVAIASGKDLLEQLYQAINTNVLPVFAKANAWRRELWPLTQLRSDVKPSRESGYFKTNKGKLDQELFDKASELYNINKKIENEMQRWRDSGGISAAIEIDHERKYPRSKYRSRPVKAMASRCRAP
mgnify:CR=1 FL=1